jgi:hypothetical protein
MRGERRQITGNYTPMVAVTFSEKSHQTAAE